jgi:hypothetical protein
MSNTAEVHNERSLLSRMIADADSQFKLPTSVEERTTAIADDRIRRVPALRQLPSLPRAVEIPPADSPEADFIPRNGYPPRPATPPLPPSAMKETFKEILFRR